MQEYEVCKEAGSEKGGVGVKTGRFKAFLLLG